jgi:hypothetical protein
MKAKILQRTSQPHGWREGSKHLSTLDADAFWNGWFGLISARLGSSERADRTLIDRTLGAFGADLPESVFRKSLVVNFDNFLKEANASFGKYRRNPLSN